jgi:hypothetical protein
MSDTTVAVDLESTLVSLRALRDRKDTLNAELKAIGEQEDACEHALLDWHKATNLQSVKGGGLTVSFKADFHAKYSPELWPEIVKWAVETGNDHIIQRRLGDAKVIELVDNGIALPDGLTLEQYVKLNIRRV